jgi:hypothetical protein
MRISIAVHAAQGECEPDIRQMRLSSWALVSGEGEEWFCATLASKVSRAACNSGPHLGYPLVIHSGLLQEVCCTCARRSGSYPLRWLSKPLLRTCKYDLRGHPSDSLQTGSLC